MNAAAPAHQFDCLRQAAEWFALLRADDAGDDDRVRWQAWMDQHEEHRRAWSHIENVGLRFEQMKTPREKQAAATVLRSVRDQRLAKRRTVTGLLMLSGSGLLGWSAWRYTPLPNVVAALRSDIHTGLGEVREITLADGTRTWLNTSTALNIRYQPNRRLVQLLRGEALFQTAADKTRPFIVETDQGHMQALGTRFTVRRSDNDTYLAVYEGAVRISPRDSGDSLVLAAGQQARFSGERIGRAEPADRARQAWTRGVLLANNISLAELADELGRYRRGHIAVSPAAAALRVMGAYPLTAPDQVLDMLADALPITVQRPLPWWTSIDVR
jgi:transmembrane sensor